MSKGNIKERAMHEMKEFFVVFLLLAPFLASFATYRMFLVGESRSAIFQYGAALVNALVLAKIILIGDLVGLGRRWERHPLLVPIIIKAFTFTLLALAFHALEAIGHDMIHGKSFLDAVYQVIVTENGEITRLGVIMFFGFIPLFGLVEIRRVMGEEEFRELLVGARQKHSKAASANASSPASLPEGS